MKVCGPGYLAKSSDYPTHLFSTVFDLKQGVVANCYGITVQKLVACLAACRRSAAACAGCKLQITDFLAIGRNLARDMGVRYRGTSTRSAIILVATTVHQDLPRGGAGPRGGRAWYEYKNNVHQDLEKLKRTIKLMGVAWAWALAGGGSKLQTTRRWNQTTAQNDFISFRRVLRPPH